MKWHNICSHSELCELSAIASCVFTKSHRPARIISDMLLLLVGLCPIHIHTAMIRQCGIGSLTCLRVTVNRMSHTHADPYGSQIKRTYYRYTPMPHCPLLLAELCNFETLLNSVMYTHWMHPLYLSIWFSPHIYSIICKIPGPSCLDSIYHLCVSMCCHSVFVFVFFSLLFFAAAFVLTIWLPMPLSESTMFTPK